MVFYKRLLLKTELLEYSSTGKCTAVVPPQKNTSVYRYFCTPLNNTASCTIMILSFYRKPLHNLKLEHFVEVEEVLHYFFITGHNHLIIKPLNYLKLESFGEISGGHLLHFITGLISVII